MTTEIKTLDDLKSFVADLEMKLYDAVGSVFDELPVEVPLQVELRGVWVGFICVNEIGRAVNRYIPNRPTVELSVNLKR